MKSTIITCNEKRMKTISIALTTYNGDKYLIEQLDSIYSQSLYPNEVVVVDDCSTDRTISILEEYKLKYNLTYFQNTQNLNVNKNFEKAIKLCNSDYIAICDQDDIWLSDKLLTLYNKMVELDDDKSPCVVSSNAIIINNKYENVGKIGIKRDSSNYYDTLIFHLSQGCSMMLNKACFNYIFPFPDYSRNIFYDYYIGIIVSMIGKKFYISTPLMYYRVHENNLTIKPLYKKKDRFIIRLIRYFKRIKNDYHINVVPYNHIIHMKAALKFESCYSSEKKLLKQLIDVDSCNEYFSKCYRVLMLSNISFYKKLNCLYQLSLHYFLNLMKE